MTTTIKNNTPPWTLDIPGSQWDPYRGVVQAATQSGISFAVGGGLAYSAYARRWRDTKDLDLFVLPADRQAMVEVITRAGFEDYHSRMAYDRGWIYRGYRQGVIVDAIWRMANARAEVDRLWLSRGPEIEIQGDRVRLLAVEELVWSKIYVLQRARCDWPDLLNLFLAEGPAMDWQHLLVRLGPDWMLLSGVLRVFSWLCPDQARSLPAWLWERMEMAPPVDGPDCQRDRRRVKMLEGGDWFGAKKGT